MSLKIGPILPQLDSGLGEEMLVGTAGIVDVNLVLVRVDVSHMLADPPLLPATGYFIAALATFGIVPKNRKKIVFFQVLLDEDINSNSNVLFFSQAQTTR